MAREITLCYVIWFGNSQICLSVQGSLGADLPQHSGRHAGLPKALQSYPWSLNEGMGLLLSSTEKYFFGIITPLRNALLITHHWGYFQFTLNCLILTLNFKTANTGEVKVLKSI